MEMITNTLRSSNTGHPFDIGSDHYPTACARSHKNKWVFVRTQVHITHTPRPDIYIAQTPDSQGQTEATHRTRDSCTADRESEASPP
jgi:hypothetical protein